MIKKPKKRIDAYEKLTVNVIKIQKLYRGYRTRQWLNLLHQNAAVIQKAFKKHLKEKEVKKYSHIKEVNKKLDLTLKLTRDRLLKKEVDFKTLSLMSSSRFKTYEKELTLRAVICLQKNFRTYLEKKKFRFKLLNLKRKKFLKGNSNCKLDESFLAEHEENLFKITNQKFDSVLDEKNSTLFNVLNTQTFNGLEQIYTKIQTKLFLDQQKRNKFNRAIKNLDSAENQHSLNLLNRLKLLNSQLESYYDVDQDLGSLKLEDLSIGCHRIRMELDHYVNAVTEATVSIAISPKNYPISLANLKKSKQLHYNTKHRLKFPWWSNKSLDSLDDDSLESMFNLEFENSDLLYTC
ncbi:hypothetical protein HK099_008298 [Clydaea vesicula]|uniref:Uncharacterized protein n=1 Tax=Clydaea vesicula TaxID=447962 RepID=A0AAD5U922_9FUNG|nr:hypothetical protein HK099_008298 [Clydaea vesicula]KAJ3397159.1 hypothetical protein HDU92_000464 [Lobulomyces angularis]